MKQLDVNLVNAPSSLTKLGAHWLGSITMSPSAPVEAGSYGTWTLTYRCGALGIDDEGSILIATRQISDWGPPQTDDPGGTNYVHATTTANAVVQALYQPKPHIRQWSHCIVVAVVDGHLAPGDTVSIVIGDRSHGGAGLQAQTFVERQFEFRVFVDCFGGASYVPLADQLSFPVVAGGAVRIEMLGASSVRAGDATWLFVRALDRWGNIARDYQGTVEFYAPSGTVQLPPPFQFQSHDEGCHRFENVLIHQQGIHRLEAHDRAAGYIAIANPCICTLASADTPTLYWGDMHGQSGETVGSTNSIRDYWTFMRHCSAVDFGAHCGNDFQISSALFEDLRRCVQRYNEPGKFVAFLSYEWSGNHAAGGDHNVYFLHDSIEKYQIERSGNWFVGDTAEVGVHRYPINELRQEFNGRDDVLIIPHVGGRRANLDTLDDVCQSPVIEISSIWGRFPWFAAEALNLGLKVGFIAGSCDHFGRPGVAPPLNNHLIMQGGLSAIYASELSRASLWEGLKTRHCYGTSGARIIVSFNADGHVMGEEYQASGSPRFTGRVAGTAPIERIELRRGLEVIWEYDAVSAEPPIWSEALTRCRLRVSWSGARGKDRNKVTRWDGGLRLDGGQILNVEPYDMRHPNDRITDWNEHDARWTSRTSGDADGVTLNLELTPEAVLHFDTPPLQASFRLSELGHQPRIVDAGGVAQQLELRWVRAENGPLDVEWSFVDESPAHGTNAYWIWVWQADGHCAWSSPVYIDVA